MLANKIVNKLVIGRNASVLRRTQTTAAAAIKRESVRPYEEIPGPKALPLLGNAWRFLPKIGYLVWPIVFSKIICNSHLTGNIEVADFKKFSSDLRNEFGDIVKISNLPGRKDMVMLFDPEAIAEVFTNEGQWPERVAFDSFKYFRTDVRPDFFNGNLGLANENGEKWQVARSVINQPMMRINVSNLYVPKSDEVTKDFIKLIKETRNANMELPDDTKNEFNKWALESISLIALDTRLGCLEPNLAKDSEAQRMINAVGSVLQLSFDLDFNLKIWKLFSTPTLKKFIASQEDILNISLKYVEQARSKVKDLDAPETPDMSVLHRILKRDPDSKRAVIMGMDILMAGTDTTSNAAAITLYFLAKNPEQQEKLYQEVKLVVPSDPNQLITAEHLERMKYLKACIKEATRLVPVAPVNMRVLQKDVVLQNYLIPKGKAEIFMFNGNLHLDDKHYPNADKFIPERWLRDVSTQCPVRKAHETNPYVYLPFGHGVRACPGMRFANMEMETLIARMLLNFKVEWHQADMKFSNKFVQMPSSPLKFTLLDRK